ncbi:MAG TPA: helix-turn-helix domain-containing protein [Pseudonocardia sp.]|jgi:AcrR family transcriptional regulator|nr:helix-turn-helix domain-containing protein [Pseudonocardia sp.]
MASSKAGRKAGSGGASASEDLLDAAERLMGERGYAATPVSVISREAGVAVTSLYWHFGSKEGLLARVMERGANRWFDALPSWEDVEGTTDQRLAAMLRCTADAMAQHPLFLRLFFMLALEAGEDEAATEVVRRVRRRAFEGYGEAIARMLHDQAPDVAETAGRELATFAVAYSDGCFFAGQLEAGVTDLRRMYADLGVALEALAPAAIARARAGRPDAHPTDPHPVDPHPVDPHPADPHLTHDERRGS